ncbi:hypothetical protein J19TS2_15480 [Cohnella xylanilytica]|nr:hypothetical protein J19TS2_15480 [Cohnella xylanilytica]
MVAGSGFLFAPARLTGQEGNWVTHIRQKCRMTGQESNEVTYIRKLLLTLAKAQHDAPPQLQPAS